MLGSQVRREPLVSVLLPVRDAAPTLERCLASLAGQTLREHEVIAVDDGSSDGSGSILEQWRERDSRVRVVHTPARGIVAALNTAASLAAAPVLARMDADDRCLPERLSRQWERLRGAHAPAVLGSRVRWSSDEAFASQGMRAYVEWQNEILDHDAILRDLLVESPLVHPTVMMPAAVLRALGGYRDFGGPEDYDLWLRAARGGHRFEKHPEVLLEWWDSPVRLTRRSARYAAERFFELKLEMLLSRDLASARPVVIWGAGPIGKSWARALLSRGRTLAAFVDVDPRKIGMRIHGAPVLTVAEAATVGAALHLAAVGDKARREAIRVAAGAMGFAEGRDLVAVA